MIDIKQYFDENNNVSISKEAFECLIEIERACVLDKIRAEIENTEIVGHIRDVECFNAGINVALNVINKYKAERIGEE